jgi:FkbM family methyltransferase
MTLISYAQNFEDVMLWRALGHVQHGFYIDVGAADPDEYSVTKVFYDHGWRGINIEPQQFYYERLVTERSRDLNLNVALAETAGEVPFFEIDDAGLSTLDAAVAGAHRSAGWTVNQTVTKVTTLAEVCRRHAADTVHFLKVDVEGSEQAVLEGADFSACRPWIVVVEATRPLSIELNHDQWEGLLIAADYQFVWFDGLNRFYVAAERFETLSPAFVVPPNIFDDFIRVDDSERLGRLVGSEMLATDLPVADWEIRHDAAKAQSLRLATRATNAEIRAIKAEVRVAETEARLKKAEATVAHAETRMTKARARASQADAHAAQLEMRLARTKMHAALAEERATQASTAYLSALEASAALRAATSWRVTAPLRVVKLVGRGQLGLALMEAGIPIARIERLKRVGGAEGNVLKRTLRIAFYVATRITARLLGSPAPAENLERLAPARRGWLQRHSEAYLVSALTIPAPAPDPATTVIPQSVPSDVAPLAATEHITAHRTRKIHQFHSGSSTGDAITNSMFLLQRWLRSQGYESDIFVEHRDPRLADRLFEIGDLPAHGDYVLIVHHSMGFDACEHINSLPANKILMYHNITPSQFLGDFPEYINYAELGRRQLRLLQPNMVAALADSEFNALELRGYGYDTPVACPFLFDADHLVAVAAQRAARPEGSPFTLLFVGRIVASKGQADLVDAFAEFRRNWGRPCRLVLVGRMAADEALYPTEIRRRIAVHGLQDEVLLTGQVTDDELHSWYHAADVFVSLSHHEGFGVPLVEAMAHGVPIVAWPAGAVPYTLGGSGELLPDRSPRTVAAAVLRIAADPSLRETIVARQRLVLGRFRLDRQAPHLVQALAAAGASPPPEKEYRNMLAANLHFTIAGHVNTTYSLSAVNRQMAFALEARRPGTVRLLPVEIVPTSDISGVPSWHLRAVTELMDRPVPSSAPEVVISQHYPVHAPQHRGNLTAAMVFWEESLLPAPMVAALNTNFDAVLAPSSQVARALIDSGVSIPVCVGGYAPDLSSFLRLGVERDATIRDIGQPVTFLHVSSCFPRKGVDVLLAAYAGTFRKGDPVRLVIKGFPNPHNDVPEQIERLRQHDPEIAEIIMINHDLDEAGMHELYCEADIAVLPTRGEGFNIPAAEAMAAGIPLIVTGHGGHLDFCKPEYTRLVDYRFAPSGSHLMTKGSIWLEPDVDDLAAALRETYDEISSGGGKTAARAVRARAMIRERLDPGRWADRLSNLVVDLLVRPPPTPVRVAWVSTWAVPCGIAEYSRSLVTNFARAPSGADLATTILCDDRTTAFADEAGVAVHPAWTVGETGNMDRLARGVANVDPAVIVIQYHEGLYPSASLAAFLSDARVRDRITVVVLHAVQKLVDLDTEQCTNLITVLNRISRVLVHRIADLEVLKRLGLTTNVTLVRQGAPRLFRSPKIRELANGSAPLIGCYGFFLPGKGIGRLIEAIAQLRSVWPRIRLRLVNAEYPYVDSALEIARCRELAASLGLEGLIEWETTFRPQSECQSLLSECDVLVLPYDPSKESSSAALRGALSSGAPVAVTPVAIFDEAIDAVYRFASLDVESVADGIDLLLHDRQARVALQQSAAEWLAEHDWSLIAQRMAGMLTGLHQTAIVRENLGT